MNKLKTILAASIAAALTMSCSSVEDILNGDSSSSNGVAGVSSSETNPSSSSGGGNSSSGGGSSSSVGGSVGGTTETYTLLGSNESFFTYEKINDYDSCEEGGILKPGKDTLRIYYSIENNILTWESLWSYDNDINDTLKFNGTSNNLIGIWTRTKDKNASCEKRNEEEYSYMYCKEDYDITKAVITAATVAITRDECLTDTEVNGKVDNEGWRTNVVDCNTVEYTKDSRKITRKLNKKIGDEMSYNGKPCKVSKPNENTRQSYCDIAWTLYKLDMAEGNDGYGLNGYYYNQLDNGDGYYDCLKETLPADWWPVDDGYDDYDDWEGAGKIAAKSVAKAKFKPLLKKKK